jgi:hypothetical protein
VENPPTVRQDVAGDFDITDAQRMVVRSVCGERYFNSPTRFRSAAGDFLSLFRGQLLGSRVAAFRFRLIAFHDRPLSIMLAS